MYNLIKVYDSDPMDTYLLAKSVCFYCYMNCNISSAWCAF